MPQRPGWQTVGPRRPPPDLVDFTTDADEEEMDEAPATPSPNVSADGSSEEMETDEEKDLLAYTGEGRDGADWSDDASNTSRQSASASTGQCALL